MGILGKLLRSLSGRVDEPPAPVARAVVRDEPAAPRPRPQSTTYLGDERAALLELDNRGMPPLRLVEHRGEIWLADRATGLLLNAKNRHLRRLGVWSTNVRGVHYTDAKAVRGPATLLREPENEHDPNAVAIQQDGRTVGYFNKQKAAALAKEMDAGVEFEARIISVEPVKVLAATREVMAHLQR